MNIFTVSEANRYIKNMFDSNSRLSNIYIRGEISNYKRHYSGHLYFTIKDGQATIRAVMFKSKAQFLKFEPQDGVKVIVEGRITVFERDGQYQLYVEHVVPEGVGELSLAYNQLKEKLAKEGLFAEERKQPLPVIPTKVGVITSPTGAVLRDIVTVTNRRHSGVQLVLYPVQVQGPEAPPKIVHAIEVFNSLFEVDVIIVGRGGGSLEELWAFNDERVVRAIANSRIPIVSAVGHQTDFTLADFAADVRAATPSQAAELVIPDVKEIRRYIQSLQSRLEHSINTLVKSSGLRLERNIYSAALQKPLDMILSRRQTVDLLQQQLFTAMDTIFKNKQHRFRIAGEKLAVLSPLAVLARGYSITRTLDGEIIHNSQAVKPNQELAIVLHEGMIAVKVLNTKGEGSCEA